MAIPNGFANKVTVVVVLLITIAQTHGSSSVRAPPPSSGSSGASSTTITTADCTVGGAFASVSDLMPAPIPIRQVRKGQLALFLWTFDLCGNRVTKPQPSVESPCPEGPGFVEQRLPATRGAVGECTKAWPFSAAAAQTSMKPTHPASFGIDAKGMWTASFTTNNGFVAQMVGECDPREESLASSTPVVVTGRHADFVFSFRLRSRAFCRKADLHAN